MNGVEALGIRLGLIRFGFLIYCPRSDDETIMRTKPLFLVAILVVFVPVATALAQDQDAAVRLRLAQGFEQSGDWERAALMYEQLLAGDPQNYVLFDGLRRSYTQLKQYEKAIHLLQQRLVIQPGDINLLAILGGLYFQSGKPKQADSLWERVIEGEPNNPIRYRLIANQMIEHRQYEKAIRIYLAARSATKNQDHFMEELAMLYNALQQYEAATMEYVRMLRTRPQQLGYVQARIRAFSGKEEGRKGAMNVVRNEVERSPDEVSFHTLLAWLCMEGREFDAALSEYRIIDRLSKANGGELFAFGQRAMQERAYLASARAFREVVEQHTNQPLVPQARFGFARALEELSAGLDTVVVRLIPGEVVPTGNAQPGPVSETRPTFQGALALYESLIEEYPRTEVAMQALFRIGMIRFDRFFDLDAAAAAFEKVRVMPYNANLVFDAATRLAEVATAQNNLSRARKEYESLLPGVEGLKREQLLFWLAELDYFEVSLDSALARLGVITANVSTDLANDALQLLYFIQENKTTVPAAVGAFAAADLLVRQKKYSEALVRFHEVIKLYPTAFLVDDAMMKIGEVQVLLRKFSDAIATFQTVAGEMNTSIMREKAQMRTAEIYEQNLRDMPRALESYEQILTKYPTSLYAEEARKRIRLLRGDAI